MIKVALLGVGRMGRQITKKITYEDDMQIVAAFSVPEDPQIGKDVGMLSGVTSINVMVESVDKLDEILEKTKPDVVIDFTNADASSENSKAVCKKGINLIIGTTGLTDSQLEGIRDDIKKAGVGAVISPNFSIGVNIYWKLAAEAAKVLEGYDVEIIDVHHRFKKDAPSGTALKTAEVIADALGTDLQKTAVYGRQGEALRKDGDLGIHAIRIGDVVGDHTVIFGTVGERLEITHRAHSRDTFVNGVIKAAKFVVGKKGIFDMKDVLELK